MGIKSTETVGRAYAIDRIIRINELAMKKKYLKIEDICFEPDENIHHFVKNYVPIEDDVNDWTNEMLGDKLDEPFFRTSMFSNYLVN